MPWSSEKRLNLTFEMKGFFIAAEAGAYMVRSGSTNLQEAIDTTAEAARLFELKYHDKPFNLDELLSNYDATQMHKRITSDNIIGVLNDFWMHVSKNASAPTACLIVDKNNNTILLVSSPDESSKYAYDPDTNKTCDPSLLLSVEGPFVAQVLSRHVEPPKTPVKEVIEVEPPGAPIKKREREEEVEQETPQKKDKQEDATPPLPDEVPAEKKREREEPAAAPKKKTAKKKKEESNEKL